MEFRRIVVSEKGRGIGRAAVNELDQICIEEFKRRRIWWDVFSFNERAKRLYDSCGYVLFDQKQHESGRLLVYKKYPKQVASLNS